jgi:hypothetical protein
MTDGAPSKRPAHIVSSAVTTAQFALVPIGAVLTTSVSSPLVITSPNQAELAINIGNAQFLAKSNNGPRACELPRVPAPAPLSDHFDSLLVAQQAKRREAMLPFCHHFT